MSKKKIFLLICLFIITSWGLVSLYYYNKHVVTVKEYKVGERIEVSEGIVIIHNIKIHDFERSQLDFDRIKWFHKTVIPKIPIKLYQPAMKLMAFYSDPYNTDLSIGDVEGRIMFVYGIYVSNKREDLYDIYWEDIEVDVFTNNGRNLTFGMRGDTGVKGSNTRLFYSSGKFFSNEYSTTSGDSLIINVKDKLSNEKHKIIIQPEWETKKYNFFNKPPVEFSFSPGEVADSFIRAVVYDEDLNTAKGLIHPQINNFSWENLEHGEWSSSQGRITRYIGRYLEFDDVFSTRIEFTGFNDEIFEQKIYMADYDGEWRIIDASILIEE